MLWAQEGKPALPQPSKQHLKVQQYSAEEDSRILKLYDGVRVADIIDALDVAGLQDITMMDRSIRPRWRDEQKFTHRIHGVALTVRLVPAQERARNQSEYARLVRPGTILVVDNEARGKMYDRIHRPRDWTVEGHTEPPPPSKKPIQQQPAYSST